MSSKGTFQPGLRMSNYVPHYTKKKCILERKAEDLQRLVDARAPLERLLKAAAAVRDARVRVLQAQRATIVPEGPALASYARIDAKIAAIQVTPVEEVLAEFGYTEDGRAIVEGP